MGENHRSIGDSYTRPKISLQIAPCLEFVLSNIYNYKESEMGGACSMQGVRVWTGSSGGLF
jgi:hypothetical protein